MTTMTGCQGVNGGGWAHYVGQEKVRPLTGFQHLAFAFDWQRPTRHMTGTSYWYLNSDQWRYEAFGRTSWPPAGQGQARGQDVRRLPGTGRAAGLDTRSPRLRPQPPRPGGRGRGAGPPGRRAHRGRTHGGAAEVRRRGPGRARELPAGADGVAGQPAGSSGKGNEYFLRHLLGADAAVRSEETPPEGRPREVVWHDEAPEGKLDLLVTMDFRMTSTGLLSDVVLPAATWYEKDDLSSTDMHPFVHAFTRPSPRPGRRAPTTTPSSPSPTGSASWPPSTWASGPMSSRCRCCTTPPTNSPSPEGW
ncbi:molybdopterin-dependent oxidoreductase [Streptomyces sp. INA 01156]